MKEYNSAKKEGFKTRTAFVKEANLLNRNRTFEKQEEAACKNEVENSPMSRFSGSGQTRRTGTRPFELANTSTLGNLTVELD